MFISKKAQAGNPSGVAALALMKTLLSVMKQKKLISDEEIDILLKSAAVEVDNTDMGGAADEAKFLITNLMTDMDGDTTTGYNSKRYT